MKINQAHLQIAFSKGWNDVLTIAPTPAIWTQFHSFIHDKSLSLIGEPEDVWLDACYQFGVKLARIYENPSLES